MDDTKILLYFIIIILICSIVIINARMTYEINKLLDVQVRVI